MFRALAACVATILPLQSGQATLTVTSIPDQCTKATGMELWRTSRQPIAHRDDQPQESFGFGIPALGGGMINV